MDPKNKIALITGGAQGIGLGITKELLKQGVKKIAVCDIIADKGESTVQKLNEEFGNDKAIFIKTDVSNEAEFEAAFKQTVDKFGGLDIVVNNAGFICDSKWQSCIAVNLAGVIKGTWLALEYMGKDKGGKGGVVVNMSSIAGVGGGVKITPIYNATKSGIVGFTRSFSSDFLHDTTGIRVMAICPGATESEIRTAQGSVRTYRKEWMTELEKEMVPYKQRQRAQAVGEGVIHMIHSGKSGSIWISEHDKPVFQVDFPPYQNMKV